MSPRLNTGTVLGHRDGCTVGRLSIELSGDVIWVVLIGIVGTSCIVAYLRDAVHVWLLWSHGIRTSGVVVDHEVNETDAGARWTPIFTFEDRQGNRVACKPIVRMDARMQLGQVVPVVYLARKPSVMLLFTRRNMIKALLENTMLLIVRSGRDLG